MKKNKIETKQMQKKKVDRKETETGVISLQEFINQKDILMPEEKRAVLKARAQALAVEKKDEKAQKEWIEIVVFRLASETYGIESSFIREVYPLKDYTQLPGTPPYVLGIVNVRGQIVSIIDLKKLFNLPEKGLGELNKVIIIHNERMEFGILADVVEGTQSVALEDILAAPPAFTGIGEKYLKGITKEHIIILEAENILNDEKIIVNEVVI
jgi:purine-binding chemotaxis protein CheW